MFPARQQQAGTMQGVRPPKVERIPMKLSPDALQASIPLTEAGLHEPVVVVVTNGKFHRQLTIHHPIGSTDLKKTDWVFSPTGEVTPMLSRATDPSAAFKKEQIAKLRQQFAINAGYYISVGSVVTCKGDPPPTTTYGGKSLSAITVAAKAARDIAEVQARGTYLAACTANNQKPKSDWKFGKTTEFFLEEDFKVFDALISSEFKVKMKNEIAAIRGRDYVTLAGPQGDRKQWPIETYGRTYDSNRMVDAVTNTVSAIGRGLGPFDPSPVEVKLALAECGDDPAKLKNFIYKLCPGLAPM